jgi:hypothetical protein
MLLEAETLIVTHQMADIRKFAAEGQNQQIVRSVDVYFATFPQKVAALEAITGKESSLRKVMSELDRLKNPIEVNVGHRDEGKDFPKVIIGRRRPSP